MKRLTLLVSLILLASPTMAQVITAASCSESAVSTALSSITTDGTTVVVPSGDCVWTTQLSYTQVHSFTLQGAGAISGTGLLATIAGTGTDLTTIEDNLGADAAMLVIVTASGKSFRMTGFHIKYYSGNAVVSDTAGVIELAGQSTSVRFDHNHIDQLNNVDLYLAGGIQGVVDHNQFDAGFADENQIRYTDPNWSGPSDQLGDGSWADSSHFGTSQFMYVEVNNFQWVPSTTTTCSGADGHAFAFDAGLDGGRGVFRFNAVGFHVALQTHGTSGGTQQHRGLRALEIYKNVLQYTTVTGDCFGQVVQLEGGTQLWWGNTLSGFLQYIHADVVRVHNTTYAETPTPNGWGYCGTAQTGTGSAWDQSATGSGYACMDSIGRGGGNLLSGANFPSIVNSTTGTIAWPNQPLEPMYTWASTLNCVPSNPCTYYSNNSSAVLVENQDYYDQLPNQDNGATFNGTAGIGSGVLSAKPSTCTAGVGWWATDQGSWNTSGSGGQGVLYICGAGNTWTAYYTPYTYPHPLTVPVITLNDASNAGCIISATNPCPRAGINVGQPSGSQPQFKNLLQFANPGFEPLQMKQIYQFQTIPCTFCSVSTFQWNLNNTQFEGYDANQWAGANFNVVQGCYVGTTGCTGGGTSDPAFGCTGTIASSTNVGGQGPQFAINLTTNQGVAGCNGTLGLAGQVIIVSSQNSMANVLGTTHGWPTSQSTSGTASITADTTDLCATCGVQAAHLTASAGGTATLTVLNTAATVGGAEKTLTLNGTYTISFWAKLNSGSTTALTANLIVRNGGACTSSGCNFVPTLTSGSWVKYSTTEALSETASPSDPFNYALSIKLTGAADAYVDNLAFVEPGTNPTVYSDNFVKALQTWCQSVTNSTGPGCTLRYGPSPDSETMADWVKSDSTRQPTAESFSTNFTNGYFTQKTGLYDWFTLNQAVGSIPVLIIPVTMTTADVANLVDYLEDNTGATTYGAIRQAQGQATAWVGQAGSPFGVIYLEYGNENWNAAFLGHVLTSHSNNPNNYYDYAVRMGVVLAAARARQAAQSYSTAVTQWIANGLTGNTTDFKYLTAYVGGQLTYSGGTITPVQGTEDAIEFQRYYGINIATVSTTGCTTNNASCPLYGPTEAETWSDFSDTSSTSGYQQSMAAIQAINFCGAAHTATCKAATYEGGMSPDGASTSTSGPFTQAVSDTFTPAGWHLSTDAVGYQLASQNSFAFTNEYQALQYYIGQGGVNVKIWGSMIDYGGDSSVTNSAKWGGVLVSGRPQMAAAMVTNYCKIGQENVTSGSSMPTYALPSNSNGVHANGSVPYLVFNEYSFGAQRCILVTNTDLVSSHTVTLAGTNVPTTVTQYQAASPTQSSTNEAANLGNTSTTASTVYPVLTASVNVGSGFTAPPMSTTALLFNTSGSPLVTVNFNSRAGGTAVAAGLAGSNCTAISASSRFDLLQAAGMNHCRLFVDINQDCPAGVCGSWSIPLGQLKLIAARGLKATVVVYNSPSNLGTNPCNPPSNNTTWAGYVNTGLALFATDYPGTVDSVELWNETDIGTVGGTSGNWCPATGTLLGAYESMIAVVGPSIASTNPSLTVGGPALGSAADAATWIPGVIGAWSGIGFISYHLYLSSTCASWAACWSGMQNTSSGITFWDNQIASLVTGAGSSAPVWLTEYNDGYAFSTDCCRFDTTYSAQWNTLAIVDHLSATTLPSRLNYFTNESTGWFCLDGNISGAICANGAPLATYPPWYAYLLVNTDLNLAPGGHLASSISPGATVSGVSAAAWYHSTGDSLLIVNPTSSAATSQPITINNTGFSNAIGTQFLLNAANGTITQSPLSLTSTGGTSYSATVTVGANSTLGILLAPPPPTKLTAVKLSGGVEVQ